jgi:hypothetical protein
MSEFNKDKTFQPIWVAIERGELNTSIQLKAILDGLGEKFNIDTLKMLEMFREWLLAKNIDLLTVSGAIRFNIITNEGQKTVTPKDFVNIVSEEIKLKKEYINHYLKDNIPPSKNEINQLKALLEEGELNSSLVDKKILITLGLLTIKETCEKYGLSYDAYDKKRFGTREDMEEAGQIEVMFDIANQSLLDLWRACSTK